jgi:hypothetical protein
MNRLFVAFRRVLLAMSSKQFQVFQIANPTIVCRPVDHGFTFVHRIPVIIDIEDGVPVIGNLKPTTKDFGPLGVSTQLQAQRVVSVIYLGPSIFRMSDVRLADVVAHEVAHVILGHPEMAAGIRPQTVGNADAERAADALAERWVSRRHIRKARIAGRSEPNPTVRRHVERFGKKLVRPAK